jgi:hypothetical protein
MIFLPELGALVVFLGCRKTNICNGKTGGLSTCQALRENPCVPPFVNDLNDLLS